MRYANVNRLYSVAGRDVDSLTPEEEEEMYSQALAAVDAQGVSTHTSSLGESLRFLHIPPRLHITVEPHHQCDQQ